MQIRLTVLDPARSALRSDVVLTAGADTTVEQIRGLLLQAVGRDAGSDLGLFVDGEELGSGAVPGVPPLVTGAVVTVGRPGSEPGRAAGRVGGFLELHVVGGPDAGQVYRLPPGEHRLGRAGEAALRIDDPDCSRVHAQLEVSASGVVLRDLGSTNGTWVDGQRIEQGPVALTERSRVLVGSSTLKLRVPDAVPAATHDAGDGFVDVNRSPRIVPPVQPVEVRMPVPPEAPRAARVPVVAVVVPLLVAIPLALFWSPLALLFGLMSPLMLLGNLVSDKLSGRKEYQRAQQTYVETCAQSEQRIAAAVTTEALRRRAAAPDNAELLRVATGPLQRLWERRRLDDDLLAVRVGTATLPSSVTVVDPQADEPANPEIDDVPVTVPLAEVGVLGIAGHRERSVALVRSLLAQLAALHSPRDVTLVVLAADARPGRAASGVVHTGGDWTATAWLPHTRPETLLANASGCDNLVGVSPEQVQRRVSELTALLDERLAQHPGVTGSGGWAGHRVVVLLDGAQHLRAVPGVSKLLEHGPSVGVHVLCLDADPARLPVECRGTVVVAGEVGTRLRVTLAGQDPLDGVVADLSSARWLERLARGLAPLRDATPDLAGGTVPDQARLLDVRADEGLPDATDPAAVAAAWQTAPRSTSALLGVAAAGPQRVDLRLDGPHALVGGTTGSGKSELLQTLIASLAVANRPDEMGFVLVDYKGGSAFADCARLPHTLGLVTDLDDDLTRRALESLTAEVTRRERLLAAYGAKDLEDYQVLVDTAGAEGSARPPRLGRLVLVIDEFRVLAEELPDFITGLVRIATVGRSLGIHLVLATQRPGGVVSADIKANVNLRIALRVRDAADSVDVVEVRDAAGISERTPGRALGRTGSSPLVEFQTARVGGHAVRSASTPVSLRRVSWPTLGEPPPRPPAGPTATGPTDLSRIVDALADAGARLEVPRPPSPWLPPLPDRVALGSLAAQPDAPPTAVPFGLLDLPSRQRQTAARFDLAAGACLAVAGTARSGRTTTLRTLAVSAAERMSPADLALFAVDGGGGLSLLAELPHTGAVVPVDDTERTARLLRRLTDDVTRRQQLLAAGHFADVAEQRRAAEQHGDQPLPWLVLLIDGFESLQQAHEELDGGRALDAVQQLVRSGPGVGLLTVVSGERAVLSGRLGGSIGRRVVLRMADPTDAVLAGVPARQVPRHLPPGRGLDAGERSADLLQVALLDADPSGAAQLRAVARVAEKARTGAGQPPFRVPPMPERVTLGELARPDGARPGPSGWLPVGLGGDDVTPVGFDLDVDGPRLLVAGHPGSGRSTALLTLARGLLAAGRAVAVVAPSPTPLTDLHGDVLGVFGTGDGEKLLAALDDRRAARQPAALLVDDADELDGGPLEGVLLQVIDRLASTGELLVLAGSTPQLVGRFHGVTVAARKGAGGLLLGPAGTLDGDLFGVRTPRRTERRPGRGLLVRRGELTPVQVALPDAPQETP